MGDMTDVIKGEQNVHQARKQGILDAEKNRLREVAGGEDISDKLIDVLIGAITGALISLITPDITISKLICVLLGLGVCVLGAYVIAKAIWGGSLTEFHRIRTESDEAEEAEDTRYAEMIKLLLKGT
jgi:hypothetical protein